MRELELHDATSMRGEAGNNNGCEDFFSVHAQREMQKPPQKLSLDTLPADCQERFQANYYCFISRLIIPSILLIHGNSGVEKVESKGRQNGKNNEFSFATVSQP